MDKVQCTRRASTGYSTLQGPNRDGGFTRCVFKSYIIIPSDFPLVKLSVSIILKTGFYLDKLPNYFMVYYFRLR